VVKLVDDCSSDGGSEDDVEVAKNRFIHATSGGARTRWGSTSELQLSPLKWVSEESRVSDAMKPWRQRWSINYTTFEGRLDWTFENCDEEESTVESRLVPQVELPADFLTGGWKHTSLGRCSVNGSFVLPGKAQGKEDARIRAVLVQGRVLLVEVVDDTWTGPSEKWLADDHVELWQSGNDSASCDRGGKQANPAKAICQLKENQLVPVSVELRPKLGKAVIESE